jgi:hypothetical protein
MLSQLRLPRLAKRTKLDRVSCDLHSQWVHSEMVHGRKLWRQQGLQTY